MSKHYKIVTIGDSAVGKTALVNREMNNTFNEDHQPTIGAAFLLLERQIKQGKYCFELWDTAGQEVFRSLVGMYTRDAKGALLVIDITNSETLKGVDQWMNFLNENVPGVKVVIAANKCDLPDRQVTPEELQTVAHKYQIPYLETSALSGQNVNEAFDLLCEAVIESEQYIENLENNSVTLDPTKTQSPKSKGCCK